MPTNQSDIAQTQAIVTVGNTAIEGCTAFSYSNDVLSLGDPFSVTVPNPRGKYTGVFQKGQLVTLKLSNAAVNNGRPTLKHTGRVVTPQWISDGDGTRIQLDCADLGWHLLQCKAPIWYNLQKGKYSNLFAEPLFDRSWGFPGALNAQGVWQATLASNDYVSLAQRLGENVRLDKGQQAATNIAGLLKPLYVLQTEPGDTIADLLMLYSRRFNLLVNVGADGTLQLWNPDYTQAPAYRIDYHDVTDPARNRNNVLSVRVSDRLEGVWTQVICVGEIVGLEVAQITISDFNAGKVVGCFNKSNVLPFVNRHSFVDGEMFEPALAAQQAQWHYKRDAFDAFSYEVRVKGHHQNGVWWESDQLCQVDDSVNGFRGTYYIQSVKYDRNKDGDITDLVLRLPGLLSAAFGELPSAVGAIYPNNLQSMISE